MRHEAELFSGWLDTSIGTLLRAEALPVSRYSFVMLSSLDSMVDLRESVMVTRLLNAASTGRMLGGSAVLGGPDLADVASRVDLFAGFDELWCFEQEPMWPKPSEVSLVGPLHLTGNTLPGELRSWMASSRCFLGLGDGIGLNYVTPDRSIAEELHKAVVSRRCVELGE